MNGRKMSTECHQTCGQNQRPKRVPVDLGNEIVMTDEAIAPLIRRLNGPMGVCTLSSHQAGNGLPARLYFKWDKYKQLMDFLCQQVYDIPEDTPSARHVAGTKLLDFLRNPDQFDARPIWVSPKDGTIVSVMMMPSDVLVLCELWDSFWNA
jgi:hypothetical protein